MVEARDPNGHIVRYEYYRKADAFPGEDTGFLVAMNKEEFVKRVIEFPGGASAQSTPFAYDFGNALATGKWQTTVTDTRATPTRYVLNGNGSPLDIHEAEGTPDARTTTMKWAAADVFKEEETDAEDRTTRYGYDGNGNLTSETVLTADLGEVVTRYAYHPVFNKLTLKTDAESHTTRYTVDDATGDLLLTEDAEGDKTAYEYEAGTGLLQSMTDPRGHPTVYADHDSFGNPRRITDPLGNQTRRSYDLRGRLFLEEDDWGRRKQVTYDGLDRPRSVLRKAGGDSNDEATQTTYYPGGQVETQTNANQAVTRFELDGLNRVVRSDTTLGAQHLVAEMGYDGNGNATTWRYDGLNRLVETVRDPGGLNLVATVTYGDPEGSKVNKAEEVDGQRGLRTLYEHDHLNRESRRTVRLEGEDGDPTTGVLSYVTETSYTDRQHQVAVKDPRGFTTVTRLDGLDRVAEQTVDSGGLALVTAITYDGLGDRKRVGDPRKNDTLFTYDGLGRLVLMADADRKTARYEHDGEGLRTAEVDRRDVRKEMAYDNLGRLLRTAVLPSRGGQLWSQETEYRDQDLRRVETDARGFKTTFELDRMGRVVALVDPDGFRKTTAWDGVNKVGESDKRGNLTTFVYDAVNRLRLTTDPAPFDQQKVERTYDDANNRVTERDRRGLVKVTQLDALGRVRSVVRSGVTLERHEYDGNGNRTLTRDAEDRLTRFDYDPANRLSRRVEGPGTPVEGATTFKHDENGNVLEERDARAAALGAAYSVKRTYDRLNRLETETDGEGNETSDAYDPEGNRVSLREPMGQETTYDYDELGKLSKVTPPPPASGQPQPVTRHDYDEARNRIRQTDANGHVVELTYDKLNRLATLTQDPGGLGLLTRHDYDEDGREKLLTDAKGQKVTSLYDELGRLKSKSYAFAPGDPVRPWRHTTLVTYAYDENSNLRRTEDSVASGSDPPGSPLVTTRTWDTLDRLETETATLPEGGTRTVEHSYYGNGLRKTVKDPAGRVTLYTYDERNRLQTATTGSGSPEAATTRYTYLPDSLPLEVTYPNGVKATHAYDRADRLTRLTNLRGPATVSAYAYGYDKNGNRLSQVETNGGVSVTTTYTYDGLDRLTTVTYPVDASFPGGRVVTYGYDSVGNRIRETEKTTGGAVLA